MRSRPSPALLLALTVFALALGLRSHNGAEPYDDLYHAKRIAWSAAHFPHVLELDPDRGTVEAFCPWPPLYDLAGGLVARVFGMRAVEWSPPLLFSLFAVLLAWWTCRRAGATAGAIAGIGVALSPYLIPISSIGAIDHHWAEPVLVLLIAAATLWGSPLALAVAMIAALFVQSALIVAAGLAFVAVFFVLDRPRAGAIAFALTAAAVAAYRLTRLPHFPDSPWFLGWTHVTLLAAAAIACALATFGARRSVALAAGALVLVPLLPPLFAGARFFAGDPWLRTIVEFQAMFSDRAAIGTDLANLTGGAALALLLALGIARRGIKRTPAVAVLLLFALAYLALALSSRRFLVIGIPLFILCGALAAQRARTTLLTAIFAAITLLPPVAYDLYAAALPESDGHADIVFRIAKAVKPLPPGRVLAG
ncbi:MAG: hypothetical protein ABI837_14800, partial [Acidobacteriota bacterium]